MNTNETPVTPFSIIVPPEFYDDLDRRIQTAVNEAIKGKAKEPTRYLTRKEVCELFNISLPTLSRYCAKGILHGSKIGNRILFDEAKIKESLQDLPVKLSAQ